MSHPLPSVFRACTPQCKAEWTRLLSAMVGSAESAYKASTGSHFRPRRFALYACSKKRLLSHARLVCAHACEVNALVGGGSRLHACYMYARAQCTLFGSHRPWPTYVLSLVVYLLVCKVRTSIAWRMPVIRVKYEGNDSRYDGSCFSEDTKYLVSVNGQNVEKDSFIIPKVGDRIALKYKKTGRLWFGIVVSDSLVETKATKRGRSKKEKSPAPSKKGILLFMPLTVVAS